MLFPASMKTCLHFCARSAPTGKTRVGGPRLRRAARPIPKRGALLLAGASDVLLWSSTSELAERVKARFDRWRAVDELLQSPAVANLVGGSPAWRSVLRQIVEVARFTDAAVLLIGESGTGKELIGRLITSLTAAPTATSW